MNISRRTLAVGSTAAVVFRHARADVTAAWRPYVDPSVLQKLPFGARSHWLQPWRQASKTIPASVFARGLGICSDLITAAAPAAMEMLARHGIVGSRIEIGWGQLDYYSERHFRHEDSIRHQLLDCRRMAIRPLILLNAHHGAPTPSTQFEVRVAAVAPRGARSIEVSSTLGVIPGRTGVDGLSGGVQAGILVADVKGSRLQLSKPLPRTLPIGARLGLSTLLYEPFSAPGSPRNEATVRGWLRYVDAVAELAGSVLRTSPGEDRGFDLEIWNELTFGSNFLSINNYYEPKVVEYDERSIFAEIVGRTAAHVAAGATRFAGVALANGFAATIPWPAASQQPARVSAICKRAYPPLRMFPRDERPGGIVLGADGAPTRYVPNYTALFPEYGATAIQTETLMRDIAPGPNPLYGVAHGREARLLNGTPAPVDVWITEAGINPREHGVIETRAAERLKTKYCLRVVLFYLGIGVARVYLFCAFGDTTEFALVPASEQGVATQPLRALWRAIRLIRGGGLGSGPTDLLRHLSFEVFQQEDAMVLFVGDGSPGAPSLHSVDCLVLLPFQSAARRLVVAYYVMTRDVRKEMRPERMRIRVSGLDNTAALHPRAFDPISGEEVPCAVLGQRTDGTMALEIIATDTPRLLVLNEGNQQ